MITICIHSNRNPRQQKQSPLPHYTSIHGIVVQSERQSHKVIDGGIGYNDPSMELPVDANIKEGSEHTVKDVLTLGTGFKSRPVDKVRRWIDRNHIAHRIRQSRAVQQTALSTAGTEQELRRWARSENWRMYQTWNGGP